VIIVCSIYKSSEIQNQTYESDLLLCTALTNTLLFE
jgi:hypothetical protein